MEQVSISEEDEFEIKRHVSFESPQDLPAPPSLGSQTSSSFKFEELSDEPMEGYEIVAEPAVSTFSKPHPRPQEADNSVESYKQGLYNFCMQTQQN